MPRHPDEDEPQFTAGGRRWNAKVRVAARAARQHGRVRYDQMRALGVGEGTVRRWRDQAYLFWELPRVYAVGHPGRTIESDLAAALLYAGPGAMLSDGTAIWWYGLLKYPPKQIHVSTPRRVKSRENIAVRGGRELERVWHRGFPITSTGQTILDFAASGSSDLLRLVLANADYQGLLDAGELRRRMGRGIDGTRALRDAIQIHLPQLALARSELEILLITFCEKHDIPMPVLNEYLHGWLVDAYWPDARVVVEVDGLAGHRTRAQLERDHQRDLELRAAGYIILRYTKRQLIEAPEAVARDLLVHLAGEL